MLEILKSFAQAESGAITVDWVVLTAAIIGMGIVFIAPIAIESESLSQTIAGEIGAVEVGYQSQSE